MIHYPPATFLPQYALLNAFIPTAGQRRGYRLFIIGARCTMLDSLTSDKRANRRPGVPSVCGVHRRRPYRSPEQANCLARRGRIGICRSFWDRAGNRAKYTLLVESNCCDVRNLSMRNRICDKTYSEPHPISIALAFSVAVWCLVLSDRSGDSTTPLCSCRVDQ